MQEILRFPTESAVVPGDNALLVWHDGGLYIRRSNAHDLIVPFRIQGATWMVQFFFLSDESFALFDSDTSLTVATFQGQVSRRLETFPWWNGTRVSTSKSGTVFSVHESTFTRRNRMLNFYDFEDARPRDLERVRIFETSTGAQIFSLNWDPRPYIGYLGISALSPNGRMIAIVRHGAVDVFDAN
jgi:hypothetical protein